MRRFILVRDDDPSGVSGTGKIAEGIQFSSGWVAVHFNPDILGVESIYPYKDLADMYLIHGHRGRTRIEWVDSKDGS